MTIKTKAATDAYRDGWDRAFGKRGGQCIGCGQKILDCRCNEWTGDGPTLAPVDAPLEAEVARLAADSPPSSDGWSVDECCDRACDNFPMFHFRTTRCPKPGTGE